MSNNPRNSIPNLAGKVVIVTGGHTGLYIVLPNSMIFFYCPRDGMLTQFITTVASALVSSLRNTAHGYTLRADQGRNSRKQRRLSLLSTLMQM
jgi:hypothetical protein